MPSLWTFVVAAVVSGATAAPPFSTVLPVVYRSMIYSREVLILLSCLPPQRSILDTYLLHASHPLRFTADVRSLVLIGLILPSYGALSISSGISSPSPFTTEMIPAPHPCQRP